jgi:heavy metal translocating P-type ATPase
MVLGGIDWFYPGASATPSGKALAGIFRSLALLFATPAIGLLGAPLWRGVRAGHGAPRAVDTLILLGISAAYLRSLASVLLGRGPVYFEVATVTLAVLTLGRYFDARARERATASVGQLLSLAPSQATRLRPESEEELVATSELEPGDRIVLAAGARVPVDAIVLHGTGDCDESFLTGESRPVAKSPGAALLAGALVLDCRLVARVVAAVGDRTLDRLSKFLEQARASRAPLLSRADRWASRFLAGSLAIAAAAGILWSVRSGPVAGCSVALAVVLAACPCAIGVAAPLALWQVIGRAAQEGILIRGLDAVEKLGRLRAVHFDKTGTLTEGRASLAGVFPAQGISRQELLRLAIRAETGSPHPFARALAAAEGATPVTPEASVRTTAGSGIDFRDAFGRTILGTERLLLSFGVELPAEALATEASESGEGNAVVFVAAGTLDSSLRYIGALSFAESIRESAGPAVRRLRALGIAATMVTGDGAAPAARVAKELEIPFHARQSPVEKVARLGEAARPLAFIGDGINDGPVLAASDIGVALETGTDLARENADVLVPGGDLRRFVWVIELSRHALTVVSGNLFWALAYNATLIGLAAGGRLQPVPAAAAMTLSSLAVVWNSRRVRLFPGPDEVSANADSQAA